MGPETHQELQRAGPGKGGGACASGPLGARLRAHSVSFLALLAHKYTRLRKTATEIQKFKQLVASGASELLLAASALCLSLSIWAASGCFCPALGCCRLSETAVAAALCRACVQSGVRCNHFQHLDQRL